MSGAFEPVEDVGAAGVVDLVKRVGVRLLNCHGVTVETGDRSFTDKALTFTETQIVTGIVRKLQCLLTKDGHGQD